MISLIHSSVSTFTHSDPAKKRSTIRIVVFVENADMNENVNPQSADRDRTFCLPHVSAKNPQKYDVETIPRNDTEVRAPCSAIVKFKSHFANGTI